MQLFQEHHQVIYDTPVGAVSQISVPGVLFSLFYKEQAACILAKK